MLRLRNLLLLLPLTTLISCGGSRNDQLLKHKKWRVYDVQVPSGDPYDITQVNQATELKRGYYSDAYYQFLDNNLFIATVDGKPDSGKYQLLSNGSIISVTASNGLRTSEHRVTVVHLDDKLFDMKVQSGEYHFVLKTKAE
ncbi:hypothetical protein [uncultured Chitinophaga sp.]|jgi:hypothetical protein|uniref:hypothetical protein n=1 Tax=uncultured Chitinophaga sp. TaxID=339340 RepID=UPI00261C9BD3|nr:hypothetical protein [uncultured Chitinophaga sp.]